MRSRDIAILATTLLLVIAGGIAAAVTRDGDGEGSKTKLKLSATTLLAAGDIAECGEEGDEATARILAKYPTAVIAALGDNAYDQGTAQEFENCYDPTWGKFKKQTRPATGNHDQSTKNAQGYWDYFGARGGPYDRYFYSYDIGNWQVVVLNSDCWRVDGCEPDAPQARWLRDELRQSAQRCTLAYWHRPPFSSGRYGEPKETDRVRPLWQILHEEGADLLLTAHEHSYERFAPMDAAGNQDDANGVRLIVVGTGGGNLRRFKNPPLPTTVVRNDDTWGVLKLELSARKYTWEFLPVEGSTFTDSGSGSCH